MGLAASRGSPASTQPPHMNESAEDLQGRIDRTLGYIKRVKRWGALSAETKDILSEIVESLLTPVAVTPAERADG